MLLTKAHGGFMNKIGESYILRTLKRSDGGYNYEYVLSSRTSSELSSFHLPLYTVTVKLTDPDGRVTESVAKDLFSNASHALDFFKKVSDSLVTPIDLAYVIEDELLYG
jgi:hypothetical protein